MDDAMIGRKIGRYQILKAIGEGGMAYVYLAKDTLLHRQVALKMIRRDNIPPSHLAKLLERFKLEAEALARLSDDPAIVTVHDYGEFEGTPYLVMAYMPRGSLKDNLNGRLDYRLAARLLMPVAEALAEAHTLGIIHRDIKPSNLLISRKGSLALADFGIAKALELDGQTLTGTGMGVGTPGYMAPEQWKGNVTPRSDIYSLGIVFYEMVTGQKPYSGRTPSDVFLKQMTEAPVRPGQLVPDLPGSVEVFLSKVLALNPQRRFASMLDMRDALEILATKAEYEVKEVGNGISKKLFMEEQSEQDLPADTEKDQDQKAAPGHSQQVPVSKAGEKQKQNQDSQSTGKRRSALLKGLTIALIGVVSLSLVIFLSLGSVQDNAFAQQAEVHQTPIKLYSPSPFVTLTVNLQNTATPWAIQANPTLPAAVTIEPEHVTGVADRRIILRIGPGENYRMLCYLDRGGKFDVLGRNIDGNWLLVKLMDGESCYVLFLSGKKVKLNIPDAQQVWISRSSLSLNGNVSDVYFAPSPPTEVPIVLRIPFQSESEEDGVVDGKGPWIPYPYYP